MTKEEARKILKKEVVKIMEKTILFSGTFSDYDKIKLMEALNRWKEENKG